MMNNTSQYDVFLEILYKKYPKKNQLVEALMDLLCLEREAVYRRLRQDVAFSANEIAKIATEWNISLDEIIGTNSEEILFKLRLWNYLKPSGEDLKHVESINQYLNDFGSSTDMEFMEVSNQLPRALSFGFLHLNKFQLFKWMYQYVSDGKLLPFSHVSFPAEVLKLMSDYYMAAKNVAITSFIWDYKIFEYLICDIRYFHSVYLITDEEKELIKKDLYKLLDYMSEVSIKGYWPETNNKVKLYISYINIDTNYSYFYSSEFKVCRVHAFAKNEIYTNNSEMIENFRSWMHSKKRTSVHISGTDEKSRIAFFMKQRQLIDTL